MRGSGDGCLTAESVQSTALTLEGVDYVHSSHGLPLGVLGVGDGITDHVLKENLEDTTGLLIDQARDTLDTTTASKTADGGLGDTLDVITKHLAMTLGAALSETLASFTTSRHVVSSAVRLRIILAPSHSAIYTSLAVVSKAPSQFLQNILRTANQRREHCEFGHFTG